jgi:hypothetical protein
VRPNAITGKICTVAPPPQYHFNYYHFFYSLYFLTTHCRSVYAFRRAESRVMVMNGGISAVTNKVSVMVKCGGYYGGAR